MTSLRAKSSAATGGDLALYADPTTHALLVTGSSGGTGGTSDTTEATQLLVKTAVQDLDTAMGTVTASPTANTLLDRVKAILTGVILAAGSAIIGKVGIDQTTPGTTDSVTIKASTGIGSLTETAPASDTASSGLNGRLQRIAQNLTTLVTGTVLAAGSAIIGKVSIDQVTSGANIVVSTTQSSTNVSTSAYATSLVISAISKRLFGMSGYNSNVAGQFIQLHDASTLPADTVAPVVIFFVPGLSNFSIDFGVRGRNFTTGIVVCNSSTGPTKTIGSADCFFDAQVL